MNPDDLGDPDLVGSLLELLVGMMVTVDAVYEIEGIDVTYVGVPEQPGRVLAGDLGELMHHMRTVDLFVPRGVPLTVSMAWNMVTANISGFRTVAHMSHLVQDLVAASGDTVLPPALRDELAFTTQIGRLWWLRSKVLAPITSDDVAARILGWIGSPLWVRRHMLCATP